MGTFSSVLHVFLHLDQYLHSIVSSYAEGTYLILFLIVFCETGLVVTPFLPGDSLLFAAGVVAATGSLEVEWVIPLLIAAAVAGDTVNFWVGARAGPGIFRDQNVRFLNKRHLERTQLFYDRHGASAIITGRFVPIIRTFVPFVAGIGAMHYGRFLVSNLAGAIAWVGICVSAGYFWGEIPFVKRNFSLVILGIIFVSLLPPLVQFVAAARSGNRA